MDSVSFDKLGNKSNCDITHDISIFNNELMPNLTDEN